MSQSQFIKTLHFIKTALAVNFRRTLVFKWAFLITLLLTVLKQGLFLISWHFFFEKYPTVREWDFSHMVLMYAIVCFCIGIVETFFYGLKELPRYIENNELDTFLLQPKNIVLNIALSKIDISAVGEMVTGIVLIYYVGYFSWALVLILGLSVLFMFSLFLYFASFAFFMKDAKDFIRELIMNAIIMASQPNVAYQGAFKMLTFTIIPVAFLSYFPIEYIRTGTLSHLLYATLGTVLFFFAAYGLFYWGLKRYESGNMMALRY